MKIGHRYNSWEDGRIQSINQTKNLDTTLKTNKELWRLQPDSEVWTLSQQSRENGVLQLRIQSSLFDDVSGTLGSPFGTSPAFRALGECEHIWPFSLRDIWATLLSPKWAESFVAQMAGDETSLPPCR